MKRPLCKASLALAAVAGAKARGLSAGAIPCAVGIGQRIKGHSKQVSLLQSKTWTTERLAHRWKKRKQSWVALGGDMVAAPLCGNVSFELSAAVSKVHRTII